ncbi:cell surface glycoprotein MUC18 [Cynoglossus semilaevis]|uniref:Cell surface glycoprotein MUC18-like n=1 Tax=Cynoglossus semilaevis TaxID=244447 RepID=A0A3P8WHG3_CYNSE|nr:cell surface glycoprotein MUC18-like [Cynoglossus semilaevis]XP_024921613.1 cell surface glycoprotein MUC18-like [Cynoglossus semilaevis]
MALLRLIRGPFLCLLLQVCLLSCSAWAKVTLDMNETAEVYLGATAEIRCNYEFTNVAKEPSFIMIQWFVRAVGKSRRRISYMDNEFNIADNETDYTGRIGVSKTEHGVLLTISDVQLSDNREFFCSVNGLAAGSAEGKTNLSVFAPPEPPVIEGITAGISVTKDVPSKIASCEVKNGFPQPNITWYKNGLSLEPTIGQINVLTLTWKTKDLYSVQSTLEYKVTKEDKDAQFTCAAIYYIPQGIRTTESNAVNITVHYPTTMVELWKESPQGLVKEGDTVELRCQGDGNPPPSFVFSRVQDVDNELKSSGDVVILSPVTRKDSGIYQCRPVGFDRNTDVKGEVQLTVHYLDPVVVVPKESELMFKGEDLTASCNALSSLKTSTVWYKNEKQVGEGTTLHIQQATYEMTGEYTCVVAVSTVPGMQVSGSVHIIVQGDPQLVGAEEEVHMEEATGRMVNLSCEAWGYPSPSVSWNVIGSKEWYEVVSKSEEHKTQSVVSVRVTSDISAQCNASNDLGSGLKIFNVKAIPRVTSSTPFSPAEGSGVIIVVIILSLLLLAILGSLLYFLHKKGKIPCGRAGKQEITKEKTTKDDIVVEMKSSTQTEGTILLKAVNGDKKDPNEK